MFFAPRIVFVEGLEDLGFILSWLVLTDRIDAFRATGCHIVPCNGKDKIIEPLIIAQHLGIPAFVIFDADGNLPTEKRKPHERDNKALLSLAGGDPSVPFPDSTTWGNGFIQWQTNLGLGVRRDVEQQIWDKTYGIATKNLGNPEGNYTKNITHIGDHMSLLKEKGISLVSLEKTCLNIMIFAEGA